MIETLQEWVTSDSIRNSCDVLISRELTRWACSPSDSKSGGFSFTGRHHGCAKLLFQPRKTMCSSARKCLLYKWSNRVQLMTCILDLSNMDVHGSISLVVFLHLCCSTILQCSKPCTCTLAPSPNRLYISISCNWCFSLWWIVELHISSFFFKIAHVPPPHPLLSPPPTHPLPPSNPGLGSCPL